MDTFLVPNILQIARNNLLDELEIFLILIKYICTLFFETLYNIMVTIQPAISLSNREIVWLSKCAAAEEMVWLLIAILDSLL